MVLRLVDNLIAITKESVKTFTYESLNNVVRFINGISAVLLAILPGKATILEGLQGWELRPTFRGPRLPRWMGNGVSSFNQLIHDLSMDSDASSVDYSSGEGDDGYSSPVSPNSQSSHVSLASTVMDHDKQWTMRSRRLRSPRKLQSLKEHFVHRATDRRRGVIEDLHLGIEIFIEAIFDAVHKVVHFLLSPSEALRIMSGWASPHQCSPDIDQEYVETVPTALLGENESAPVERKATFHPLNTDARTCQDVITELGYPYEAVHVITEDGYILLLERIPRRDSRKAVYLQHGVMDSSLGWVSNGVVGSPAFAAFDQGYDVFLGNFRGLVSREHVDRTISSRQYWRYSINEHGTKDIPAMIEKIHEVKTAELKLCDPNLDEENSDGQPYNLCAICHSLGGAGILMYAVTRRLIQEPHRLSRLILLSPAGFHDDSNFAFTLIEYMFLALAPIMVKIVPAFYIPTRFFRMLLNKLARDFHNYPAVGGLVQTLMSYIVGGDSSNWVGVLGLPHYNMNDMPGVSFYVALHLAQMKRSGKFRMFDYGTREANMHVYESPEPLDMGEYYGLIDIPVDLVAGKKDKVIRPTMVRKHYTLMNEAGVDVSYTEYEYAHLDFTFCHHEELLLYVMSRLQLVKSTPTKKAAPEKKDLHEHSD
ncbi:hypothetical protein RND81_13G102700 [Saponaria officinalis]|uniref:Partial AB-hydrolase lipase domain-containing protein n=1 Tax=Saponaria officinalis TaxID=3572 RepID=A0AAW1GW60_SAPOF